MKISITSKLDTTGWDKFTKKVNKVAAKTELSFTELFPDRFVSNNTDFHSLQEMFNAGGLDKPEELDGEPWSQFIATHSRFSGWAAMLEAAHSEWLKTQLSS